MIEKLRTKKGEMKYDNDYHSNKFGNWKGKLYELKKEYSLRNFLWFIKPEYKVLDFGCVDKDTEFLTPKGWKKISDYVKGDLVMQFNIEDNSGEFVKPIRFIKKRCNEFVMIKTKYGINQLLSKEHRCLVYPDRGYKILSAEEAVIAGLKEKGLIPDDEPKTEAPFELEGIEDAKIIIMVKGKHYSIISNGDKEEARAYRVALVQMLLSMEGQVVITPSLEEITHAQ